MNAIRTGIAIAVAATCCGAAFAQTTGSEVQRNLNQQERIEQGLQSGQLTTREASKLEGGEARIDRMESNAMKDGSLSPAEKSRIQKAQNAESAAIHAQKHDAQTGNPASPSSQRMQADVQRNINQQARIKQGVSSGALTTRETGSLERGQAHVARKEAVAGADGHVGPGEQARVQGAESRQSARVYHKKHNDVAAVAAK
jgi:hypothetical protein